MLQAIDGKTGRPLWDKPALQAPDVSQLVWPQAAIDDLDGDGRLEVITARNKGYNAQRSRYELELVVFDSVTGQRKWNRPGVIEQSTIRAGSAA